MTSPTLEDELKHLKSLNATVDLLLDTAKDTQSKIHSVKSATDSTAALLEDWIRILNQTQFTRSALQDPQWKGSESEEIDAELHSAREAELEAELQAIENETERLAANLRSLQKTQDQLM